MSGQHLHTCEKKGCYFCTHQPLQPKQYMTVTLQSAINNRWSESRVWEQCEIDIILDNWSTVPDISGRSKCAVYLKKRKLSDELGLPIPGLRKRNMIKKSRRGSSVLVRIRNGARESDY